jgi:hypothetical protein
MALAGARPALFDDGRFVRMEGPQMRRILFVLVGLTVAFTVSGLVIAFARPSRWPANIAPSEWRRALGERVEQATGEVAA